MAAKQGTKRLSKKQAWEKRLKGQYAKFKRVENRQKIVDQARRAVYQYLVEMIHENIEHARQGNSSVAKFLMSFAGIDEKPAPTVSKKPKCLPGSGEGSVPFDPASAIFSFNRKLGMEPLKLKPPKPVEEETEASEEVPSAM